MSVAINNPSSSTPATASAVALSQHVIVANFVVTAGYAAYISRYYEIADTIEFEIGDDGDMEIG